LLHLAGYRIGCAVWMPGLSCIAMMSCSWTAPKRMHRLL